MNDLNELERIFTPSIVDFYQMLEKLLLVHHFVTFEVTQLTHLPRYDMLWSENTYNWSIFANLSRFCRYSRGLKWQRLLWMATTVSKMATIVPNGNDRYERQPLFQKWQRLFQMGMTVMNGNHCFQNGNDRSKWEWLLWMATTVSKMTITVPNGNDRYDWQWLFQKWQRLFQMTMTVMNGNDCFKNGNGRLRKGKLPRRVTPPSNFHHHHHYYNRNCFYHHHHKFYHH